MALRGVRSACAAAAAAKAVECTVSQRMVAANLSSTFASDVSFNWIGLHLACPDACAWRHRSSRHAVSSGAIERRDCAARWRDRCI
jgi:hypothetical protein